MADNVKQQENQLISTEEVSNLNGGAVTAQQLQRIILALRTADGTAVDVAAGHPLPVNDALGEAVLSEILAALGTGVPVTDAEVVARLEAIAALLGGTIKVGDGGGSLTVDSTALGTPAEAEASGEGGIIGILKRIRTRLGAGLPGSLSASGNLKTVVSEELPTGTQSIGQVDPRGNVAHDGVDSGNPVKVGGRARTALPAAVAQDDRADLMTDKHGRLLVTEYPRDQKVEGRLNLTTNEEKSIIEPPGAGLRIVVTEISITNSSTGTSTKVEVKDDTTAKRVFAAGKEGGGAAPPCPPGGFFTGSENKAIKVKAVTTGADVEVHVSGYKIPA